MADFRKIIKSYFLKIRPAGAELFHTGGRKDRQTDARKLTVAFRNLANAPKNELDENSPEMFEH